MVLMFSIVVGLMSPTLTKEVLCFGQAFGARITLVLPQPELTVVET